MKKAKKCKECGKVLSEHNKSGLCEKDYQKWWWNKKHQQKQIEDLAWKELEYNIKYQKLDKGVWYAFYEFNADIDIGIIMLPKFVGRLK